MKLASRRRRIALPGGGAVSAVVALPPGFRRPGRTPAVILAHGAGSDMTNPFLSSVHAGLAREGLVSVKFNFPYTEARRRAPDPRPVLQRCYRAVVDAVLGDRRLAPPWIAIGGKSLGGRIASYVAADGAPVRGLLFLGYPLHPAGRQQDRERRPLPAAPVARLWPPRQLRFVVAASGGSRRPGSRGRRTLLARPAPAGGRGRDRRRPARPAAGKGPGSKRPPQVPRAPAAGGRTPRPARRAWTEDREWRPRPLARGAPTPAAPTTPAAPARAGRGRHG